MTVLVAMLQVATPLQSATLYWAPGGATGFGTNGTWDLTNNNWRPNADGTGTATTWSNLNDPFDTAYFGKSDGSAAPSTVTLAAPITVDGITLNLNNGTTILQSQSATETLTFSGTTANINLIGSTSPRLVLTAALEGTNLNVSTTGGNGTLFLNNKDSFGNFYANNLTGNITVNNNTTLEAFVYSAAGLPGALNPLGDAGVVLKQGAKFRILGEANTLTGISGREFTGQSTGNTSRIDFTGAAAATRVDGIGGEGLSTSITAAATGIQWVGKVNVSADGALYSFNSQSDDGSRLFIDGVMVVNNDGGKGSTPLFSAPIKLAAGVHDIRVDYVNGSGGGAMALTYSQSIDNGLTWSTATSLTSMLTQAEVNSLSKGSSALQLGNDVTLEGNAQIILEGPSGSFSSAELGGLTLHNSTTLTVATENGGAAITTNGAGFGRTLRFGGASVLGHTGSNRYRDDHFGCERVL